MADNEVADETRRILARLIKLYWLHPNVAVEELVVMARDSLEEEAQDEMAKDG